MFELSVQPKLLWGKKKGNDEAVAAEESFTVNCHVPFNAQTQEEEENMPHPLEY